MSIIEIEECHRILLSLHGWLYLQKRVHMIFYSCNKVFHSYVILWCGSHGCIWVIVGRPWCKYKRTLVTLAINGGTRRIEGQISGRPTCCSLEIAYAVAFTPTSPTGGT